MSDVNPTELCRVISLDEFRQKIAPAELADNSTRYEEVDERTFGCIKRMIKTMGLPVDDLTVCSSVSDGRHSVYQVRDSNLFAVGKNKDELEALSINLDSYDSDLDVDEALIERFYTASLLAKFLLRREAVEVNVFELEAATAGELILSIPPQSLGEHFDKRKLVTEWRVAGGLGLIATGKEFKKLPPYLQDTLDTRVGYEISACNFADITGGQLASDAGNILEIPAIQIGLCNPVADQMLLRKLCAPMSGRYIEPSRQLAEIRPIEDY